MKKILSKALAVLSAISLLCGSGAMYVFAEDGTDATDAEWQAYLDSLTDPKEIKVATKAREGGIALIDTMKMIDWSNGTYIDPILTANKSVESTDLYYGETDNGIIYQFEDGTLTLSKDESFTWSRYWPKYDYTETIESTFNLASAWKTVDVWSANSRVTHTDEVNYNWKERAAMYPWNAFADEIQHIVFEDEFDTLGAGEFYNCVNLESFDYPLVELWSTSLPSQIKQIELKEGASLQTYMDDTWTYQNFAADIVFTGAGRSAAIGCQETTTVATDTASSSADTTTTTEVTYGDANLDGRVTLTDAILIARASSGSLTINETQRQNMDCNADGVVSGSDATSVLRFLTRYIRALPDVSDAE